MNPFNASGSGGQRRQPLPINREGAYQGVNRNAPVPVTPAQQQQRITALRNQIGHPEVLDSTLRYSLMHVTVNWDVNRAAQHFWQTENLAMQPPARPTSSRRLAPTV